MLKNSKLWVFYYMNIEKQEKLIKDNEHIFNLYFEKLVSYNEKVNLTAITEKDQVFNKHFLDSILPVDVIPQNASVVDVGTGAGFPSLPLKIVRSDIDLTMVDSLNKRINFLNELTDELKIKTTNIHARAEDFALKNREKFDVAVARAVARLNTLLEYLLPLVKVGGIVLAYKGSSADEEIEEAKNAISILGGKVKQILHFDLPDSQGERNVIVIEKIKSTPKQYPRGKNLPKLNPIK